MFKCFMLLALFGCSTFTPDEPVFLVKSSPRATVKVVGNDDDVSEVVGETPISLTRKQIETYGKGNRWVFLKLESPGYASENIILDQNMKTTAVNLKLRPVEWWNDPTKYSSSRVAQLVGQTVKNTYRLIRQGKIDEAMSSISSLIKEYPFAAIFYDIQGSLFVLKNQNDLAITSFEKSLQIESNEETLSLVKELRKGRKEP